jgi:uncharacterized membrane protein
MSFSPSQAKTVEKISMERPDSFKAGPISLPYRWLYRFEWFLLFALITQIGFRTAPNAWRTLNSDFPNYYLTGRLVHEHYDASRVYDWIWLQRQKDHREIDQRIVTMVPITPFSTLAIYPLASLSALSAKHYWTIFNFALLIFSTWLLRDMTEVAWRRICLIVALSLPLRANLLLGQYYILLLFLLTLSCWLYLRQRRFIAGIIVGVAAGLKVFPGIYLLFFLRKKDWRAFTGGVLGVVGSIAVSVRVFGWELNRAYLTRVLPATLRGEGLDPYNLQAASVSSLLHRLFIYEPQLNPHPALNAAWMFALLQPLLQMLVLAPAMLLVAQGELSPRRVKLEWAGILLASLTMSTSAASYLFTLLILPVVLILDSLDGERRNLWTAVLLTLYFVTGVLGGKNSSGDGWIALASVPRLYALVILCVLTYYIWYRQQPPGRKMSRDLYLWAGGLFAVLVLGVVANIQHQRGLYADYRWRIALPDEVIMAARPAADDEALLYISMLHDGYHSTVVRGDTVKFSETSDEDQLAVAAAARGERWIEQTGRESSILSSKPGSSSIRSAESPVASFDGRWLAFVREDHGRSSLWVRDLGTISGADRQITPPGLNVLEMSFLPEGTLVFAAASGGASSLFMTDHSGGITSLGLEDTRYPSVSPDGHLLAYSHLEGGSWNLWLRNLENGQTERLTHAACNDTEATWTKDSQELVYASDCGRGLGLSALCRRHIVPPPSL